jgi:hypothetical protein
VYEDANKDLFPDRQQLIIRKFLMVHICVQVDMNNLFKKQTGMKRKDQLIKALSISFSILIAFGIVFIADVIPSQAWSAPTLDGKLDDVYREYGSITRYGDANTHEATGLDFHPAAYLYVLEDDNYVYVFYHQDVFYANDNSYGDNSIHWEARKNGIRNFADIWESDMGEFTFKDANGTVVAHFYVDQLAEDATAPSGYACGGFGPNSPDSSPWNDGLWLEGDTGNQSYFEIVSVMDYNLNSTGYCTGGPCTCGTSGVDLLANSPAASDTYQVTDSGCSDWQWYNGWEMQVDKQVFGVLGFGVVIGNHHNSPTKTCTNKQKCEADLILPWSTIGDRVWHDLDGDGVQDSGEPGLQGVSVELIDPRDGSLLERQITDSNGEYVFEMLSHFYYIVQVDEGTLPTGFTSTTAIPGPTDYHSSYTNNICLEDCIQRDGATYTNIYYVPLDHPQDYRTADFGYRGNGAVIGDYVWSDADNDGVQDLGEPGIGGVLLELLDGDGIPTGTTTTTNDSGWYMFVNLSAGDYKVRVASSNSDPGGPLEGYTLSPGPESNPTPTDTITLATNEAYINADFGYYQSGLGSIGDYVWFDADNDGTQDAGEDPAEGVTLALYIDSNQNTDLDAGEPVIADTITDETGTYSFTGLELNEYYLVKVTDSNGVLDGFTITTYWGDDPGDPVDIDRYNDPAPVHLTDLESSVLWADFGYNRPGSIGDTVWFDWDQDGEKDPGEGGVGGVTVELSGTATDSTTTSEDGSYLFTQLSSGTYYVTITIPTGYSLSTGTPDNPHGPITLTGNLSYLDADFGLWRNDTYTIGDLVWDDLNGDGYKDVSESGIADVTLELYEDTDGDGVQDPTEPRLSSVTTGGSGQYSFYGLLNGDYLVIVTDDNNILEGYTWTDGVDDTNNYSQVTPYAVTINNGSIDCADFGYDLNPTWVLLSSFEAYDDGGYLVLEWTTASESGTAGFKLSREERGGFIPVHEGLLPAFLHSPQGGIYRYLDGGADPDMTYRYRLTEVASDGTEQVYGPFVVEAKESKRGSLSVSPASPYWRSVHHMEKPALIAPLAPAVVPEGGGVGGGVGPGFRIFIPSIAHNHSGGKTPQASPVKVFVSETGLYYLSSEVIAEVMDIPLPFVESMIQEGEIQLNLQGQEIAYLPETGNTGIYFFGEGIESIYTNENVYWLIPEEGETVTTVSGTGPEPLVDEESFTQTTHFEEDHYALTALFADPQADYWLWDELIAGDPAQGSSTFTFCTDGATRTDIASLDVYLQGATDPEVDPDQHVIVRLNDQQIGESWWDGTDAHHFQISFDADLLNDGDNILEVMATLDTGVPYSIFYLDSFDVTYERYYRAVDDNLIFPGKDLSVITVRDFSNAEIFVFDITNAQQPTLITATTIISQDEGFSVSFEPEPGDREYLAVSLNGLSTPYSIIEDSASDLKASSNQADYLLITTDGLLSSAQPLLTYRQGQGYQTMVVELEDIYDEFNHGIANPEALKAFLDYAYHHWSTPPSFVVLFGGGTYDYKDNQGHGDHLIPTVLVSGLGGLFASDTYFADVIGDDGVPDFAIGRIPVVDSIEAGVVISKILNFESSNTALWANNVLMLADNPDHAGDFSADSDGIAALIPEDFNIDPIYLSQLSITDARQEVIAGINSGAGFVNYIGHAGLDRLAHEGLLMTSDAPSLTNGSMLPIMTAMTCVAGRFEIPGHDVFAEIMLLDNDGGAVAVWAPTGLSINEEAVVLDEYLVQAIFEDGVSTIGEAVMAAFNDYAMDEDHLRYMLEIYNLLGDPAMDIGWNQ